jgi:hypothetical protein
MNKHIVMLALTQLVTNDNYSVTPEDKKEALNELLRIQRIGTIDHDAMQRFRQYRTNAGRLDTVKMIRKELDCGLSEALIIVKGIEIHDNISTL